MEISLTLPYPPSSNRYWRTTKQGRTYVSEEARSYRADVGWLAKQAGAQLLAGALQMTLHLYRPRKTGDSSNRVKVLEDALQGILYANDSQIIEHHIYRHDDKQEPRVELTVKEIEQL